MMTYLEDGVLIVHVLAALAIIGVVMLQHGKGAEMGAGFGSGASATVFGSAGSGNFLTRTTTVAAAVFFVTSFSLAYFAKERAIEASQVGMPTVTVQQAQHDTVEPSALPAPGIDAAMPDAGSALPENSATTGTGSNGDEELPDVE